MATGRTIYKGSTVEYKGWYLKPSVQAFTQNLQREVLKENPMVRRFPPGTLSGVIRKAQPGGSYKSLFILQHEEPLVKDVFKDFNNP